MSLLFSVDVIAWKSFAQLGTDTAADFCRLVAMKFPALKVYNASDVDATTRDVSSVGSRRRGDQAKGML